PYGRLIESDGPRCATQRSLALDCKEYARIVPVHPDSTLMQICIGPFESIGFHQTPTLPRLLRSPIYQPPSSNQEFPMAGVNNLHSEMTAIEISRPGGPEVL